MSYDLYLRLKEPFGVAEFFAYFNSREHYVLSDDGTTADFEHPDTGTYFSFGYWAAANDHDQPPEDDDDDQSAWITGNHISFNMNYFRPHVFGLEAAGHVDDLVHAFGCAVHDPQIGGMGDAWSRDGFLEGWDKGNEFGYGLLKERKEDNTPMSTPRAYARDMLSGNGCIVSERAIIETVWRWNLEKNNLQSEIGEEFFVPTIVWAAAQEGDVLDTQPMRVIVWGAGVPIVIPDIATHAVVMLDAEPRGLRGLLNRFGSGENPRQYVVDLADVRSAPDTGISETGNNSIVIPHGPENMPNEFLAALDAAWPANQAEGRIEVYPGGQLRDLEMIEKVVGSIN